MSNLAICDSFDFSDKTYKKQKVHTPISSPQEKAVDKVAQKITKQAFSLLTDQKEYLIGIEAEKIVFQIDISDSKYKIESYTVITIRGDEIKHNLKSRKIFLFNVC